MSDNNNTVIIELDRPRELRLSHKVFKKFLAKHNLTAEQFDEASRSYDLMTDLLSLMLMRDDPELTQDDCDDLLDMVPIHVILEKVPEAIEKGFNTGKPADPTKAPQDQSTGSSS